MTYKKNLFKSCLIESFLLCFVVVELFKKLSKVYLLILLFSSLKVYIWYNFLTAIVMKKLLFIELLNSFFSTICKLKVLS